MSKIGFVIMQIGNKELDELYDEFIVPVLKSSGFEPKRVDKDNDGELLKPKIIDFITDADLIVADLTNERPNVYLEVGYAMGLGKYKSLILTAREDHYHGSPNYKSNGHKVHFDLNGYDILFWDPNNKEKFSRKLTEVIQRRTYITQPTNTILPSNSIKPLADTSFHNDWYQNNRQRALNGLKSQKLAGYMEISSTLSSNYNFNQIQLRDAAREAPISTFGWPIGAFLNTEGFKPKPINDGIFAEIVTPESEWGATYDYWVLRSDASFYLLQSLFEDTRGEKLMFFDTRIVRVTESLLYLARFYNLLRIDRLTPVSIVIEHGGMKGRTLKAAGNRLMFTKRETEQDLVRTVINTTVEELDVKLSDLVANVTKDLFVVFDYFEVNRGTLDEIVRDFVNGKIS